MISAEPISHFSNFSGQTGWRVSFPLWLQALRTKAWSYLRAHCPLHGKNLTWNRSKMTTHRRCEEEKREVQTILKFLYLVTKATSTPVISTIYLCQRNIAGEQLNQQKPILFRTISIGQKKPQYRARIISENNTDKWECTAKEQGGGSLDGKLLRENIWGI